MTTPKISFIYAYPLDAGRRRLFAEKDFGYYPTIKEVKDTLSKWESVWDGVNTDDRVMLELMKVTKKVPTRSLECFVFGGGMNPMSTPFLMPVMAHDGKIRSDDEDFIQIVIYELLHIFVTADTYDYWIMVREKYKNEDVLTQNHIIIYAMLQKIYRSLFEKDHIDFSRDNLPSGYSKAIQIVKQVGHKNIIDEYYKLIN